MQDAMITKENGAATDIHVVAEYWNATGLFVTVACPHQYPCASTAPEVLTDYVSFTASCSISASSSPCELVRSVPKARRSAIRPDLASMLSDSSTPATASLEAKLRHSVVRTSN
jgi:hypothetical protein